MQTETTMLMELVHHYFNTSVAIPNVEDLFRRHGNVGPAQSSHALTATK